MAIVSYNYMGTLSESVSPSPSPRPMLRSPSQSQTNSSDFLVSAIGIIALSFWLLSEYIFFRQCCLSRRRGNNEDTLETYSPMVKTPGLGEDAIRSIPIVLHKEGGNGYGKLGSICECAVCLNEFQDNEKLRVIPTCNHAFHIDCIDTWLQNNANCPLCRTTISRLTKFQSNLIDDAPMQSSSLEAGAYMDEVSGGDEDFVVIELDCSIPIEDQRQRMNSGESLAGHYSAIPWPRDLEEKVVLEGGRKFDKATGVGDECIDTRGRDDEFTIEPFRRSFSMDSLTDRQRFFTAQKVLKQNRDEIMVDGCNNRSEHQYFVLAKGE